MAGSQFPRRRGGTEILGPLAADPSGGPTVHGNLEDRSTAKVSGFGDSILPKKMNEK
jgi:hypothetical protein